MASDERNCVKMSGYLEKKGKMKMLSSWKNYWFVLEGRLLLYYRSKDEYDALSPCKGSISLSPTCSVKPLLGTSCVFQIETRVNNIVLKAKSRLEQDKWMHALLAVLKQTPNSANGMLHFRYSSDELMPRRTVEDKNKFSRQYTLPERLNVEKRHTLCRSFETIRPNLQKNAIITKRQNTGRRVTDIASTSNNQNVNEGAILGTMTENTIYNVAPEYLRGKVENPDHIYERISCDSRLSDSFKEMIENDTYVTTTEEITRLLTDDEACVNNDMYVTKLESNNDDIIVDNVEYCTPDIIGDTNLVNYHEYTIPDKDYIYSVPNVEDIDHNENRIQSRTEPDVNPYSVCHIYPKSKSLIESRSANRENMYDDVMEYAVPSRKSDSHVSKLIQKLKKTSNTKNERKNDTTNITKKVSFLQKLFRRQPRPPKKKVPDQKVEEIEYAEINVEDENAVKKLDSTYCVDKKLLHELELLLNIKRRHLQEVLNDKEEQNQGEASTSEEPQTKQLEADTSVKHKPKIPNKVRKKKYFDATHVTTNKQEENLNKYKSIDEILDELEEMKKEDCITSGRVKKLIDKFDKTIKTENSRLEDFNSYEYDIVLRRKNAVQDATDSADCNNSSDELNRLLSELAKVTNAPIMMPGVTNSLSVTSRIKDAEFIGLMCKNERRLSEPDYDIPRPHTNLRICRDKYESDEDVLPATRFFGPVLPNYESKTSPPLCSMAPDSLEFDMSPTTTIEASLPSYSSHKYDLRRKSTKQTQRRIAKEEIFIDSLEPQDEASTIL